MQEDECEEYTDKGCGIGYWDVHGVQDEGAGLSAGRGCRRRVLSYPGEVQGFHWAGAAESWGCTGECWDGG